MPDLVISVEKVGKRYTLKHKGIGGRHAAFKYDTLRDVIARQGLWHQSKQLVRKCELGVVRMVHIPTFPPVLLPTTLWRTSGP